MVVRLSATVSESRDRSGRPCAALLTAPFDLGRLLLKALLVCLCLAVVVTQAASAAGGASTPSAPKEKSAKVRHAGKRAAQQPKHAISLEQRLARKVVAAKKQRSVVRFFANHRWLLSSAEHRYVARTAVRRATRELTRMTKNIGAIQKVLRRREARRLANAPPKVAICDVFGSRYCDQALSVSWCESRHSTTAQNGQYLGLFQMGSSERALYGHGSTPREQAEAAHRYFVSSGRDWSPWSCKPWWD